MSGKKTYAQALVELAENATRFGMSARDLVRIARETPDSPERDAEAHATVTAVRTVLLELLNEAPELRAIFVVPPLR